MIILFSTIVGGVSTEIVLEQKPTLHNTKPWYCLDEPTCQRVIYWSISGPNANKWVYSLVGLDGAATSILDNSNQYPISADLQGSSWVWDNLSVNDQIESSIPPFINLSGCGENDGTNECLNELALYFSTSQFISILDSGLTEVGTIASVSNICKLKSVLLQLDPTLTPTEVFDYYIELLDKGFVVDNSLQNCQTVITTIEGFLMLEEADQPIFAHNLITCNGVPITLYSFSDNILDVGVILYKALGTVADDDVYCTPIPGNPPGVYGTCYVINTGDGVISSTTLCL